jgi:hypothetical protein
VTHDHLRRAGIDLAAPFRPFEQYRAAVLGSFNAYRQVDVPSSTASASTHASTNRQPGGTTAIVVALGSRGPG